MEWIFNGKHNNTEVYKLACDGMAEIILNVERDKNTAVYQITYTGKHCNGTIDFSNCLPNRRIEFCKEETETKLYNMVFEDYKKAKKNFDTIGEFMYKRAQESMLNTNCPDYEYDILR